jgi:hypothetical protein
MPRQARHVGSSAPRRRGPTRLGTVSKEPDEVGNGLLTKTGHALSLVRRP